MIKEAIVKLGERKLMKEVPEDVKKKIKKHFSALFEAELV